MTDRLSLWLKQLNPVWFVLLLLTASYVVLIPTALLSEAFPALLPGEGSPIMSYDVLNQILLGVVLGPLFETALFQWSCIEILSRKTSFNWQVNVCISALLFGAAHRFSWGYVLAMFLVGLVFAYGYAVRRRKGGRPIALVFLTHALRNALSLLLIGLDLPHFVK